MASPMPSRRHLAAAPSLRPSISAGDPLGFGGEPEPVTARAVCLPSAGTLVHGRSWRISLALASSIALSTSGRLLRDEPVESGPRHVPVDPYDVLGHGSVSWFPIAVFRFGE